MKKLNIVSVVMLLSFAISKGAASSIFVPRQLSYNPIFENADACSIRTVKYDSMFSSLASENCMFLAKPIYTQNVGSKLGQYFSIDQKPVMNVQEDGSGDIDSLWFDVQAPLINEFYSSELSFNPVRQTFGVMLNAQFYFTQRISFLINTALVHTKNSMNISETNIPIIGQSGGFATITDYFANPYLQYGASNGPQSKTGLDDIQLKLVYQPYKKDASYNQYKKLYWQMYVLAGIPTSQGSQAKYIFEPLVGSNHAQVGLGGYAHYALESIKFQAEVKWRYAFSGDEIRSFDLANNGQWSRYLLLVNASNTTVPQYPAIDFFTFTTKVNPGNSFDLYLSAYWDTWTGWHAELGYDLWIRQAEKVALVDPTLPFPAVAIADLPGIAIGISPTSASTATISQGNRGPGYSNQIISDAFFTPIQVTDFNLASGAAPLSISNSIYGSVGYTKEMVHHLVRTGIGFAYERGHGINVPNNVSLWLTFNMMF